MVGHHRTPDAAHFEVCREQYAWALSIAARDRVARQARTIVSAVWSHARRAPMRRRALAAALCLAALLGVGLCLAVQAGASGPVYGVAALRVQLAREGSAWLGRTIRVRAAVDPCGASLPGRQPCPAFAPGLVDGAGGPAAGSLPLQLGPAPRTLAVLRRIPLLGRLLPGPQALRWGAVAVYRVRLVGCSLPSGHACYAAVLLDAAPVSASPADRSGWPGGRRTGGPIPSTD